MSGHSKWSTIKRLKGAVDAKRAKIFAKLSREVTIAAKLGGGDPALNPRLRMVLLKARAANMPTDNVERAIKKGAGGGEAMIFEDLTYEIYGPNGVAIFAEASTDNRNRTAAEIRSLLNKNGGSIATSGAVTRLFDRKGQIIVPRDAADEDSLMELALDAGAEDFIAEPEGYEILTDPGRFEEVYGKIDEKGIRCEVAEVRFLPTLTTPLDKVAAKPVSRLIDALEEHDDVKDVYTTAEFPEEDDEAPA